MRTVLYVLAAVVVSAVLSGLIWGGDLQLLPKRPVGGLTVRQRQFGKAVDPLGRGRATTAPAVVAAERALIEKALPAGFVCKGALGEQLTRLSEVSGVQLEANWGSLKKRAGVTRETVVDVNVSGMAFGDGLMALKQGIPSGAPLRFLSESHGTQWLMLCLMDEEDASMHTHPVIYDVTDIVIPRRFSLTGPPALVAGPIKPRVDALMNELRQRFPALTPSEPEPLPPPTTRKTSLIHDRGLPALPVLQKPMQVSGFATGTAYSLLVTGDDVLQDDVELYLNTRTYESQRWVMLMTILRKPVVLMLALVGVTLAVRVPWVVRDARRRRRMAGRLCIRCGYDVRHSPEKCPECGARVPGGLGFVSVG